MKRAVYDKQFKLSAVKLAGAGASSAYEVAKEISISTSSLHRWINEYDEYGESEFPGHGNALLTVSMRSKSDKKEKLSNLTRRIHAALREENEILKKAPGLLEGCPASDYAQAWYTGVHPQR